MAAALVGSDDRGPSPAPPDPWELVVDDRAASAVAPVRGQEDARGVVRDLVDVLQQVSR